MNSNNFNATNNGIVRATSQQNRKSFLEEQEEKEEEINKQEML